MVALEEHTLLQSAKTLPEMDVVIPITTVNSGGQSCHHHHSCPVYNPFPTMTPITNPYTTPAMVTPASSSWGKAGVWRAKLRPRPRCRLL